MDQVEQKIDRLGGQMDHLTGVVGHLATQMHHLTETVDHLAIAMLGQQTNIEDMQQRLGRVESNQERTFNRMDEFLLVLNRHDTEIVAGRGAQQRLEERVEHLEQA